MFNKNSFFKKYCLCIISICLLLLVGCSDKSSRLTPEWSWSEIAGGPDDDLLTDIDVDSNGNIYVTGYINDIAKFGDLELESSWDSDAFIAKMSPAKEWLWIRQIVGLEQSVGWYLTLDDFGNCYFSGIFTGKTSFGEIELDSGEQSALFLAKVSPDGEWLWVNSFTSDGSIRGSNMVVDAQNNLYFSAYYTGNAHYLNQSFNSSDNTDFLIAKINPEGEIIRTTIATAEQERGIRGRIAIDYENNILVAGNYKGTASFGDKVISAQLDGDQDYSIYAAKINSQGEWLWVTNAQGIGDFNALTVDNEGNSFLIGTFEETISFDDINLQQRKKENTFFSKINGNGEWVMAKNIGINYRLSPRRLIMHDSGEHIYMHGSFNNFNPLSMFRFARYTARFGKIRVNGEHTMNFFIAQIDTQGNWQWVVNLKDETKRTKAYLGEVSPPKTPWYMKGLESTTIMPFSFAMDRKGNLYTGGGFIDNTTTLISEEGLSGMSSWSCYIAKLQIGNKN